MNNYKPKSISEKNSAYERKNAIISERVAVNAREEALSFYANAQTAQKLGDNANSHYRKELNRKKHGLKYDPEKLIEYSEQTKERLNESLTYLMRAGESEEIGARNETIDRVRTGRERNAKSYFEMAEAIRGRIDRIDIENRKKLGRSLDDAISAMSLAPAIISMTTFGFALIFSSFSITGLAINEKIMNTTNYFALGFFVLGIVFALIYIIKVRKIAKIKKNSKKDIKKTKKDTKKK